MVINKVTQSNQLRVIGNSETFSSTTRYTGSKRVEAVFSIRRDAKSPRYEKKTLFDFSGGSEEQLHLLAVYGAKVKLLAILRALSPEVMLNSQTMSVVDVKRIYSTSRSWQPIQQLCNPIHPKGDWPRRGGCSSNAGASQEQSGG